MFRLYLSRVLAESTTLHGVFLDVLEMGVLITGASAIGKSELALELISRGNGLVADDIVELYRISPDTLEGRCPAVLRDFLEVRGIGILNIRTIFGETAVRPRKLLKLMVHLEDHSNEAFSELDRLQVNATYQEILGVPMRKVTIPVAAGRNLAVLVEAAVRNFVLNQRGIDSTKEFIERQQKLMEEAADVGYASARRMDLLLIGGVSGSGKNVALAALEDSGYYAVNNLPLPLVAETADHLAQAGRDRVAIALDAKTGPGLAGLRGRRSRGCARVGLERALPLSRREDRDAGQALLGDAPPPSVLERRAHADRGDRVRARAARRSRARSASCSTPATCRRPRCAPGSRTSSASTPSKLTLLFESFGFKHGVPLDADLVFDVRCLPNPHYEPALQPLTGRDAPVVAFLEAAARGRAHVRRHLPLRRELAARLRARQPQLPDRRDRLHRRPAPLGLPRRAARARVRAALPGA